MGEPHLCGMHCTHSTLSHSPFPRGAHTPLIEKHLKQNGTTCILDSAAALQKQFGLFERWRRTDQSPQLDQPIRHGLGQPKRAGRIPLMKGQPRSPSPRDTLLWFTSETAAHGAGKGRGYPQIWVTTPTQLTKKLIIQ